MPEAGYLPIPSKLARAGVKDMVRISDARMSGTAYGTIVLHTAPEAAVGGPLAIVRNGDRIALSVSAQAARTCWSTTTNPAPARLMGGAPRSLSAAMRRCIATAYCRRPEGCDFDFLVGAAPGPE